jgi:tetratricopeptide (TPR) repeat protein
MDTDHHNIERGNPPDHDGETPTYFISYSHQDREKVEKIRRAIQTGSQNFHVWFDESNLEPGCRIDATIENAIDTCSAVLFAATRNSVQSEYCLDEIALGREKKKTIVPLLLERDVKLPFRINGMRRIDFSANFEGGLKALYDFLSRGRRESSLPPVANEPVGIEDLSLPVPAHFLGRNKEQQEIKKFVSSDASAVLWISGRAGSGKTALACHVLNLIGRGKWVSSEHKVPIHAVVYLDREHQSRRDWFNVLHTFRSLSNTSSRPHPQKGYLASAVEHVLSGLSNRRVVLLVDHLDDLIDLDTRNLTNPTLHDALQTVLTLTVHKLKVIVTSRVLPSNLRPVQSGRLCITDLGEGLPQAEAMQLLKLLGQDKSPGLQDGDDELLAELCQKIQGNPRAIEKLHAILQQDHDTSVRDILQHEKEFLPRAVMDLLIGESYACLDDVSKTMMQVLSVSETPITAEGVASVFRHYHPNIDARQVLSRLVNMQLVQKKNECYWLLKGDWSYVASQLVGGTSSTLGGPESIHLDRFILCQQYANYFKHVASASDTTAEAELLILAFHHHCNGKDYVAAVDILKRLEPHLFEQGRYQEVAHYYEQLDGKLEDCKLVRRRLDRLAWIYQRLGKLDRAAAYYGEGLKCVRDEGDQKGQGLYLANLAICKQESCDLVGTTLYCKAALELAQQTGEGVVEAQIWNIIGDLLAGLGQIPAAIQAIERALKLARDSYQRELEVVARVNLGQHYEALGDDNRAQEECDRACRIVVGIRFQLGESAARRNLGILQLNRRRYRLAVEDLTRAMQLADATQSVQLQQTTRIELATALLLGNELTKAEATVGEALQYDTPLFSPEAYALRGVILQQQGKVPEAAKFFSHALEYAQVVLKRTSGYYRVLDAMGLSYSGLTLSENEPYLDEAIEAYQASRLLTHDPGIVRRRLHLFEALAQSDSEKKLASVRDAIDPQ